MDTDDTLAVMAQKLEVSVSLLSSVESGAREIPPELSDKIRTVYRLDAEASDALLKAECETLHKSIAISLGQHENDEDFKKAAISISRDLQELSVEDVQKIAAEVHEKAQSKRQSDFSGWAALGAVAIGYIIFPLDLIPDITPVIGYGDDLASEAGVVAGVAAYSDFSLEKLDAYIDRMESKQT